MMDHSAANNTPESAVQAILADNRPIFREGLRAILDRIGVLVIAEVSTLQELREELPPQRTDVVVLGTTLLGRSLPSAGSWLGRQIGELPPVLAIHSTPAGARQIMQAGARGCISTDADAKELSSAVTTVISGGYYLDAKFGARILSDPAAELSDNLTPRELKVLEFISAGLTNRQIADQMHVSLRTVESHRANLKRKTGLHDRSQLSEYARQHLTARALDTAGIRLA